MPLERAALASLVRSAMAEGYPASGIINRPGEKWLLPAGAYGDSETGPS